MITIEDDGAKVLCFVDWDEDMMALASALWDLPPRPGSAAKATHEYGVDALARMRHGRLAINLLYDCVDELEHRPDEDGVIRLGRRLLAMDGDFNGFLHGRKVMRGREKARQQRQQQQPTPKFGFVRGPKAGG